ncbi:AAA family ATPase [bacterium]|nr:AAA family ATPase [bacterium]
MSRTLQPLLQGAWLIVALVTIYVTLRGMPLRFDELRTTADAVWAAGEQSYVDKQLHPREAEILFAAGLSVADYAAYILILEFTLTALFFVSALLIFRQRRQEWLAVTISMALLCIGLTTPAIDSALVALQPGWYLPLEAMQAFGLLVAFALTFLAFPDGRLTPPWTRYGLAAATMLMLAWFAFPDLPYNPINGESWEKTPLQSTLFSSALIGAAMWAQVQRYRHYATPLQRQQIKAGSFGFLMLFVAEVLRSLSYALTIPPQGPGALTFYVNLFRDPIFLLLVLFLPLGFGMAILRYQLWNLDTILRRTALYSLLTAGGVFAYIQIVIISSLFLNRIGDFGTIWFTAASALLAALLLLPTYRFAQSRINRAFNRSWLDFQAELARFSRSVRTYLHVDPIAEFLAERVCALMQCDRVVVALCNEEQSLQPAATRNYTVEDGELHALAERFRARLTHGDTVNLGEDGPFHLLVPLTVQRADQVEMVGLLLCGFRSTGQPYDRTATALLTGMADQAASAILVAEMVAAERKREQHRNTPLGQAELLADDCSDHETAQSAILGLFERAVTDPLAAQQLAHLPAVLRSRQQPALEVLAEGCHLLVNGRKEIDDVAVGLQRIHAYLHESAADNPAFAGNQALLAFFQRGLACTYPDQLVAALTTVLAEDTRLTGPHSTRFAALAEWTTRLSALGPLLDKYQRSQTVEDRMAYLVDAVTYCTRLHAEAISQETTAALIVTPMLARWYQFLAETLRLEQSRSLVSLTAVTHRVVTGRPTHLVLEARNDGLQPIERVSVAMHGVEAVNGAPASVEAGTLLPGEATRLHFPVTLAGTGPLNIAFRYHFTDLTGGTTNHGVVVPFERLGNGAPFQAIPNPYVTGAPLRAESPLFVGRSRERTFLHAALNKKAETPSVLLTGPKRMGKTSLLFQLPRLLGDAFVPVYVDVQGIGYDIGLGNLLLDIAVEIAQSVGLPPPTPETLNGNGDVFFAQHFLPQVRTALGTRRLVLVFDEFEELVQRVAGGILGEDVFSYLRHLMQHEAQLAWVFAGTQRLADLSAPYWLSLFSGAVHSRVGMLDADDARRLIQEPVTGLLTYDDLAVDKILRLTGGHPYFTQVLCHALVLDANRARRTLVTAEDVDAAMDKTMEMAEAHLLALWRELDGVEREVAVLVARLHDHAAPFSVEAAAQHSATQPPDQIDGTLTHLLRRDVLAVDAHGRYRFVMELQRQWIVRQVAR